MEAEALNAVNHFNTGNSLDIQIVVATPTGIVPPGFPVYCAYHSVIAADPEVTYTSLPYITDAGAGCGMYMVNGGNGLLDGVSINEGHELAESITDPEGNGWFQGNHQEIGDKCAWTNLADINTMSGTFAVQPLWSNGRGGCTLSSGGAAGPYEAGFEANYGALWTIGPNSTGAWNLGMMPGTSPSVAALANGGYEAAFQSSAGELWVAGTAGVADLGLAMAAGTSPSITGLTNGGYEIAYQATNTSVSTVGSDNHGAWNIGMMAGTSPAVTGLANGGYEVAFQSNGGSLWTMGSDAHGAWNLGMAGGTSPTITD
jgi:hypothetical protein